jgi:cytochrome c556
MKKTFVVCAAGLAVALLAACSGEVKDTHPQQWVSKRKAVFKQMTKALEPMGLMTRDRQPFDKGEFVTQAMALQELASKPWPLFPADSNYPPTRAKPALWLQAAEFKKAADDFQSKVAVLSAASGAADMDTLRRAVNDVEKSCKSCHDQFRTEH